MPGEETSNVRTRYAPMKPELPRNQHAGGLLRQKKTPATGSTIAYRRHGPPRALRHPDTHTRVQSMPPTLAT